MSTNVLKRSILKIVLFTGLVLGCADDHQTSPLPALPAAPTQLRAIPASSSEIRLDWLDDSSNEDGVIIESKQPDGIWIPKDSLGASSSSTTIASLAADRRYAFRVKAYNALGSSAYSNEAVVRTKPESEGEFGFQFAWIPAGSFEMGSPITEQYRTSNEGPTHTVVFGQGFYMLTTEVSQGLWKRVMGEENNPAHFRGDSLPMENIGWVECIEFLAKLNELDSTKVYRMPTEAEWEYACRAGTSTRFFWGNDPDYSILPQYAWTITNSLGTTHPIAQKQPNPWGLYDICGNVYEWVQDTYLATYDHTPIDGSAWEDPAINYRCMRGGGWTGHDGNARSAARFAHFVVPRVNNHGFRIVYE